VLEHGAHDIRLSTLDQFGKFLWRQMRRSIDQILVLDRVKGLSLASQPAVLSQSRAHLSASQPATCF
jgi:hypothetical protein